MKLEATEKRKKTEGNNLTDFLVKFSRVGILIILSLGITLLNPDFLKVTNILNVVRTAAPQIIIAFGMTFVMLTGGIDLSLGSVVTLTCVVAGYFLTQVNVPWPMAVVAALAVGALSGATIALLISVVKLPPAVASYGMLWVDRGLAFAIMGAKPFFDFPESFRFIGRGSFLGIPMPIWIVVVLTIGLTLLLKYSTIGRCFYALGANASAARASGLEVKKVVFQAYIFSGMLAAIGGLILAARLNAVDPDIGAPFLMPAIASPVMGGTSMTGGQGGVGGTVIGSLIMIVVTNGMNLLGISSLWQQFVTGIVVILAVWFDIVMRKRAK